MRERAVRVGHLVSVFTLLNGATTVVCCVEQFARQTVNHGRFIALARSSDQPANCQRLTALGTYVNRNLLRCTTHAARTNFYVRSNILQRLMENLQGLLLRLSLDCIERTVDDGFGNRLLAMQHDGIHELRDNQIAELWIRIDLTLFCFMTS